MSKEPGQVPEDVRTVIRERSEMVRIGQEILSMLGKERHEYSNADAVEIQKKILEFMQHVANIAGFCDNSFNRVILQIQSLLGISITTLSTDVAGTASYLRAFLPLALMIPVDFKKRPFRVVGFDIRAFQTRFRTILKRDP